MLFKDLKPGYPIFLFSRTNVEVRQGKIVNVTPPHLDTHYGNPTEMVVDITIEDNGQTFTYAFKDSTEVGYTKDLVVSPGRDVILREVEVMKTQSEQALAQVDNHKAIVEKCSQILSEFNPALKERKETEERFSKLEGSVGELKSMMQSLINELKG